ncbi:MAG TPA: TRAP transporter small permease [Burkholderiales bacterium]|nr:TRAP transporter small permease [Burkholderiales bacterium]
MSPRRTPEEWIAALGMAALCVITMANVVVRYLSDESFAWTEEFSVFLLVLTTMAGTAAAALRDNHIRIEYFFASGSASRQRALAGFGALITAVFFLVLAVLTGRMAWDDFHYAEISSGLGVPRWWYTAWVPAFSVVIAIRVMQSLKRKSAQEE